MAITYTGTGLGGAIDPAVDDWTPVQGEQVRQDLLGLDGRVSDVETVINAGLGTGDVTAGATLTDNGIVCGDGGAKGVQTSGITIADGATGTLSGTNTGDVTLAGVGGYLSLVGQVLTRTLINLASHVTGRLPFANIVTSTAAVRLVGRGTGAGGGDWGEVLLGTYLKMTGNVLDVETSALASGGGAPTNAAYVAIAADPTLTHERVLTAGVGISLDDQGAGQPVVINATPQAGAQNTYLVTGGQIVWIADYEFLVSAATYFILGQLHESAQATVTLAGAHATLDRIDVIAVDDAGAVVVVSGTAAAQPSEPDVDPGTQLKLGIVYVAAASTAPATATDLPLYLENAGDPAEWDWTTSGSGFDVDSTTSPRTGTKAIEGTTVANGAYAQGEIGSGTVLPNDSLLLAIYIKSKATWNNNRGLSVSFRLNGALVGSAVNIQRSGTWGFDSAQTSTYQLVAIPISAFSIPAGSTANQIRIADFGGSIGFHFDDLSLQGGAVTPQPAPGLTKAEADTYYAPNLGLASQAQAVAGTAHDKYMTPLRTAEAIAALAGAGSGLWTDDSGAAQYAGQYYSPEHDAGNSGTSKTIDWNDGNTQLLTLTGNVTLTLSTPKAGGRYLLILVQDGTGSRTVTWPASVKWAGGTPPTLSTAAGAIDIVTLARSAAGSGIYLAAANLDFS